MFPLVIGIAIGIGIEACTGFSIAIRPKHAVQGADRLLDYLGPYVHRVAITNARIWDSTEDRIRIRYLDRRKRQHRYASLQPDEFIRHFLLHVLLRLFHKVRNYKLLSPRN